MFPSSKEENYRLRSQKTAVITLGAMLLIMALVFFLPNPYSSRTFTTIRQFVDHIQNEQFDSAKAMIDQEDLKKIPDEYWEQFRGIAPDYMAAPTVGVFVGGAVPVKVKYLEPVDDWREKIEIRFEVCGKQIRVQEVWGTVNPP